MPCVPQFFVELQGQQDVFKVRLGDGFGDGRLRIPGIPYAQYELHLSGLPARWPELALPRTIDVQSPSQQVEIDLAAACGLELSIERSSGQAHEGYARVMMLYAGPADAAPLDPSRPRPAVIRDFMEPPYLVYPLAPGRYELALVEPFASATPGPQVVVDVGRGEIAEVRLVETP